MDGAAWFDRAAVEAATRVSATMDPKVAAAARAAAGGDGVELLVPPPGTIARNLIDLYLSEPFKGGE